jgi:hypothetical protein
VHSDASSTATTDWRQIVELYDLHMAVAPSPVVALHRAVAVAEVEGPAAGLALVESLDLDEYRLFHSVRADLLRRLGRNLEASAAYESAITRAGNVSEREFLADRLRSLGRRPEEGSRARHPEEGSRMRHPEEGSLGVILRSASDERIALPRGSSTALARKRSFRRFAPQDDTPRPR